LTFLANDEIVAKVQPLIPGAHYISLGPSRRPTVTQERMNFLMKLPLEAAPFMVNILVSLIDMMLFPMARDALAELKRLDVDVLCTTWLVPSQYAVGELLGIPVVGIGIGGLTSAWIAHLLEPPWSLEPVLGSWYTKEEIMGDVRLVLWNTAARLQGYIVRNTVGVALTNLNRLRLGLVGLQTSQFESVFSAPLVNPFLPELTLEYPRWTSFHGVMAGLYDHPALGGSSMMKSDVHDQVMKWLDDHLQKGLIVLYAAFGSEIMLDSGHIATLSGAFEACGASILWALKNPPTNFTAPANVFVTRWVQQKAVLAHGAVRAFLSHGGGNSAREALAAGKPMLVMPFLGDQPQNAMMLEVLGVAIRVHKDHFTPASFSADFRRISSDPYQERAAEIKALNDRRANLTTVLEVIEIAAHRRFAKARGKTTSWRVLLASAIPFVVIVAGALCAMACCRCFVICCLRGCRLPCTKAKRD